MGWGGKKDQRGSRCESLMSCLLRKLSGCGCSVRGVLLLLLLEPVRRERISGGDSGEEGEGRGRE